VGARQNLAPYVKINLPTTKGNKMVDRFKIQMFDEVKANDLTLYSDEGYDNESLKELVFSNIKRFDGNVKAFVYDQKNKKKTAAAFFPMETVNYVKALSK
jgi:hypothetical protein